MIAFGFAKTRAQTCHKRVGQMSLELVQLSIRQFDPIWTFCPDWDG